MPLDAYQPCPCGSNKKVKFCCSKDIMSEFDRILTAINSDQRVAALDQINRLIEAKGERDCLLVTKASTLMQLKQTDKAQQIVDRLLEHNPENPLVLSQAALLALRHEDVDGAVVLLQNAMDQVSDSLPSLMLDVMRMVGYSLLMSGRFVAGRVHLSIYLRLAGEEDEQTMSALMRSYSSPSMPLLLKEDFPLVEAPEDADWTADLQEVFSLSDRACFRSAIEKLRELEAKYPSEPVIRRNIAILESRLGDIPAMVDAWRTYARTPGVASDDAVEAEAMAQLLDDDPDRDYVEEVAIWIPVTDVTAAMEKMLDNKRFDQVRRKLQAAEDGSPPPKAAFHFLDRPVPEATDNLTLDMIPEVRAEVLLFGKQTDRDAYVMCVLEKDAHFDATMESLKTEMGDLLGEVDGEEVVDRAVRQSTALSWRWRMPEEVSAEVQDRLAFEKQKQLLHEVWPDLPLDVLDGKTPREAAEDPEYQIPLQAAILLLEESGDYRLMAKLDINELRSQLGVPTLGPIDPTEIDIRRLPLVQLNRVDVTKLPDDDVVRTLTLASMNGMPRLIINAAREVISRDSITDEMFDKVQAHVILMRLVESPEEALEHAAQAQAKVRERGQNVGVLKAYELEARLERGVVDGTEALLREIDRDFMPNPEVARELARVLGRFGLLEGGAPGGGVPAPEPTAMAGTSAQPQAGLWTPEAPERTPGGPPTPPPAEDGPSKLWLPGMD